MEWGNSAFCKQCNRIQRAKGRFVNHYMLQQKQKEFAIQSIMGMEQKTIGRIFFAETMLMGMISIVIGIFFGVFCSQFITAMLLTVYDKPYEISWTLRYGFKDSGNFCFSFFSGRNFQYPYHSENENCYYAFRRERERSGTQKEPLDFRYGNNL